MFVNHDLTQQLEIDEPADSSSTSPVWRARSTACFCLRRRWHSGSGVTSAPAAGDRHLERIDDDLGAETGRIDQPTIIRL